MERHPSLEFHALYYTKILKEVNGKFVQGFVHPPEPYVPRGLLRGKRIDTILRIFSQHTERAIMLDPWSTAKKFEAALQALETQKGRESLDAALLEARAQGLYDFHRRQNAPPQAYLRFFLLRQSWQDAYNDEYVLFGEHRCLDCRLSLFAGPCPIHGNEVHVRVIRRIKSDTQTIA